MTYDNIGWHNGKGFPSDLNPSDAGTHIGMFLGWAVVRGLVSQELEEDFSDEVAAVRSRQMTGRDLLEKMDGKVTVDDLNKEGNSFASTYYASDDDGPTRFPASFDNDYVDTLASDTPTLFHVEDSWHNFDLMSAVLDRRFDEWKALPA